MSKREIPASLRRAGLTGMTHNLPEGFAVNFHADFVRIFKDEIQRAGQGDSSSAKALKPAVER